MVCPSAHTFKPTNEDAQQLERFRQMWFLRKISARTFAFRMSGDRQHQEQKKQWRVGQGAYTLRTTWQ
jgi:hypothetical protein